MTDSSNTPTGIAASAKVIVDAIKTIFGAAVVILFFFGLSLVLLASGAGDLESSLRGDIIKQILWLMIAILVALVVLRIFKPDGLSGPPQPETKGVKFSNSTVE